MARKELTIICSACGYASEAYEGPSGWVVPTTCPNCDEPLPEPDLDASSDNPDLDASPKDGAPHT